MSFSLYRDYKNAKAPGAAFAILLTLCVNVALFTTLGWVNGRKCVGKKVEPLVIARPAFPALPRQKRRTKPKKNVIGKRHVKSKENLRHAVARVAPKKPNLIPTPRQFTPKISMKKLELKLMDNNTLPIVAATNDNDFTPIGRSEDIVSNDGVERPATAIYAPKPKYPLSAKRLGRCGVVRIELIITAKGIPKEIRVAHSSGYAALDRSALLAIGKWRFKPAFDNGRNLDVKGEVSIKFTLEK